MKQTKITFLISLTLVFSTCTMRFVPEYSSSLEEQIVNGAKLNDKMYLDMLADDPSMVSYSKYASRYAEIAAEINSIELRNKQRDNNQDMLKIIEILKKKFQTYENEHRAKANGNLTSGEIKANQSYISGFWLPLLKAEGGLKKVKSIDKKIIPSEN